MNISSTTVAVYTHRLACRSAVIVAALMVSPIAAQAADWICANSFWDIGSCWDTGVVPGAANTANVNTGTARYDILTGTRSVNIVNVESANLQQTGGSLTANTERVGIDQRGDAFVSAGTHTVVGDLILDLNPFGSGFFNLSGSGVLDANVESIGHSGTGQFTQTGGTNSIADDLRVGNLNGGDGTYTQSNGMLTIGDALVVGNNSGSLGEYILQGGGTLNASQALVGNGGEGTLTQSGGTIGLTNGYALGTGNGSRGTVNHSGGSVSVGTALTVGNGSGGIGVYNLSGTGSLTSNGTTIGRFGTGSFNQSGGTHMVNGNVTMGAVAGAIGFYDLSGGTWTLTGNLLEGGGTSIVEIDGGTLSVGGGNGTIDVDGFSVGASTGSIGSHTLAGTGMLMTNRTTIGNAGQGTFTQSGGTHAAGLTLELAKAATGDGTYLLNSGMLTSGTDGGIGQGVDIGRDGFGNFHQNGGTHQVNGDLSMGLNPGSLGRYFLNGGTLSVTGSIVDGGGSSGFLVDQGSLSVGGSINVDLFSLEGNSGDQRFVFGGGNLNTLSTIVGVSTGTNTFTQNGGTHNVGSSLTVQSIPAVNGTYILNNGVLSTGTDGTQADATIIGQDGSLGAAFNHNGGTHTANGNLRLNGPYRLAGGTLNVTGDIVNGGGALIDLFYDGGTLSVGGSIDVTRFIFGETFGTGSGRTLTDTTVTTGQLLIGRSESGAASDSLTMASGATITASAIVRVHEQGVLNLSGGTLELSFFLRDGIFNWFGGTLRYSGDQTLNAEEIQKLNLGPAPTLFTGRHLAVAGTATITEPLRLNGGELSVGAISAASGANLELSTGTFNLTASDFVVGNTGQFGPAFITGLEINLVQSNANPFAIFTVASEGDFRTAGNLSAGNIVNAGSAVHVGSNTILPGLVDNQAGAQLTVIGTGFPISYGNDPAEASEGDARGTLVGNRGDIVLSDVEFITDYTAFAGSTLTVIGAVDLWGDFTGVTDIFGPGTFTVFGNFNPGTSPTGMTVEGDLTLVGTTTSELGGVLAGDEYDQTIVEGTLTLGGLLDVQLVDAIEPEYAPEMGDSFTLFIAGEIIGQFDDMVLPAFGNGLRWNDVYGANALSLQVVPLPAGIWLFVSAMGALRVLSRRQTG